MQVKRAVASGTRPTMTHEPEPQVVPKAERRRFRTEYKPRILAEADRCIEHGQIDALLRREGEPSGPYSSHLTT